MFVRAWCVLFEETGGGGGLLTSKETERAFSRFPSGKTTQLAWREREREREREEVCFLHHRDLFFSLPLCRGTNVVAFVRRCASSSKFGEEEDEGRERERERGTQ